VRIAEAKYIKEKVCDTLVNAVEVMFEECVIPNLPVEANLDTTSFRSERLYVEEVDDAYRGIYDEATKFGPDGYRTLAKGTQFRCLEEMYRTFKMPVGGGTILTRKTMQVDQWMHFVGLLGFLDDETSGFTIRHARLCYVWSQMRVVDDFKDNEKFESMQFTDFLEALARVAELIPLPPIQQIRKAGFRSALHYFTAVKSGETDVTFPRRASQQLMTKKTRPLAEKLEDLLDYVFRVCYVHAGYLDEHFTLEKGLDAIKQIFKTRKAG